MRARNTIEPILFIFGISTYYPKKMLSDFYLGTSLTDIVQNLTIATYLV